MRRAAFFVIIGLGGAAILIALGVWQTQRLAWKQGVIADIEARIAADPVALPAEIDPERDSYLPVEVSGTLENTPIFVLVSHKELGAGHRAITPMITTQGRRILVDVGFSPAASGGDFDRFGEATLTGNLQWPQEIDGFTPEPDLENNIWFARDVPAMAARLNTEAVMVVMRAGRVENMDLGLYGMPVDTARIPNNHLQYAITWFSLAAIWLAMSAYFLRRKSRPSES